MALQNTGWSLLLFSLFFFLSLSLHGTASSNVDRLITKKERRTVVSTDSGQITAVDVKDGHKGPYHLQFFSLESSSLFLPVILHKDMVFYVHTGRGTVVWVEEDEEEDTKEKEMDVVRGDIYSIRSGSVFYVQSHPDPTREKLRIYSIFNGTTEFSQGTGAYSTIKDMVLGFDKKILQMAFQVPEELIEEIASAEKPPSIVHLEPKNETNVFDWREGIIEAVIRGGSSSGFNKSKKKKTKPFNIFKRKPDFENCNGWSLAVDSKTFRPLRDSNIGVFLVNLTKGSMMGPHWNPRATEISIVIHGQGIVTVVCSGAAASDCKNSSIMVKEGDVFVVPRFHPMAQISFNNDSLVFMGFSTMAKNNYPQYLAGKSSVLQTINREILATSFNVSNTTIDKLLAAQADFIILDCTSCAEEEERRIEEEIEKQKQEEEEREREAAAKKREEEEAKRREEEGKRREEEEAKRREEEEEAKKREEEEEAKRREEEEEEAKRREEEEAKKREEEEEAKKREEEEEAKRREEEAKRREEEEAAKKREEEKEEEEEAQRQKEEEEAKRREEEEAQRQKEEEEEARRQQEEEEEAKQREEEEARRREEEEARRQKEEEEAARRREEEEAQRQREEEAQRKEEEEAEAQRKREEEKRKEEGEGQRHGGGGEEEGEGRRVLRKMWKI